MCARRHSRRLLTIIAWVMLVLAALVVWLWQALGRTGANATSMAAAKAAQSHAHSQPVPKINTRRVQVHTLSPALRLDGAEFVDLANHWFEPPAMTAASQFSPSSTALTVDPSCAGRSEMRHATIEHAVRKAAGVDPTQALPLDALTQQVSQFWQQDGWYYQLSASWEKDIPPVYSLEYYRTRQADFKSTVERLVLPNSAHLDALAMAQRIEETVAASVTRGAIRGARLTQLLLGGEEGDSLQDLKILNGRPVAWMFGYGHCRARKDGTAFCRCVDPATASREQKQEYRVID